MSEKTKEMLLEQVRAYKLAHKQCGYRDYEMWKSIFHDNNIFNCEKDIADILEV